LVNRWPRGIGGARIGFAKLIPIDGLVFQRLLVVTLQRFENRSGVFFRVGEGGCGNLGRVFQNPFSGTSPSLTIRENLSLAARRGCGRGLGWGLKASLVAKMRDEVSRLNMGLEDRLENAIGSLSGGQRQALTLLMATWLRPELLLLDEHTAALDPKSADLVIALTEQVIARDKLTTLMVTHSMHQAASLGDRLIMMHRGQIIHDFQGAAKRRQRPDDLLARFEEVRRAEQLDESAAQMLAEQYV